MGDKYIGYEYIEKKSFIGKTEREARKKWNEEVQK